MKRKKISLKTKYFDFSKPRLKISQDGKNWYYTDKYGIAYLLDRIKYRGMTWISDIITYKELKEQLKEELIKQDYKDVHIYI